ncbi:MAG: molybdopterin cofactor-binding domain-containing protein [Anaerolineales bacterium]|nr:molybdopterin cofactor-binding domain-containing protein [Anaerolineales bacterium]
MATLNFIVNHRPVQVEVQENEYLAEVLRYRLSLTGTKIGCNEAECGICTVLVNGTPVVSCIYPALKAEGAEVLTIEGLAEDWRLQTGDSNHQSSVISLHPLQRAFAEGGAPQCGFCIPGIIMTGKALLDHNPEPSEHDVKVALKDTYCRCAGYSFIIHAIQAAARVIREEGRRKKEKVASAQPSTSNLQPEISFLPPLPETKAPLKFIGRPLPRPDAIEKVTGAAKYTDDYAFPGMLHARTLRAKYPHALIKRINTSKAKALPGVHAVLTADDIPGQKNHGLVIADWPALAYEKVRYIGDPVAIVAADTREIATQALDLIEVEYEPLPVVTDPLQARRPDAPLVMESGNLLKHIKVRKGDVAQGFAEADVVLEKTFYTPFYEHAFLEPECAIGRIAEDGRIEVIVGSQIPYQDRSQIARCLGVPDEQVRVIGALIGGGFGGKEDIAGQIHVALLAKATGRPVKMLYDRHESLIFHPKRHATIIRVKIGAKQDGTLTAVETELYGDSGAYASLGEKVMTRATTHSAGPYEVPHVKADCYAMYTNNPPAGAFRGFGVTQSAFAIESIMDMLAEKLGIDPIELRRKNLLRVGSVTNTGQLLRESVGAEKCLELVANEIRRQTANGNPWSAVGGRKRRAWGVAMGYKNTGLGGGAPDKSAVEVELYTDGTAEVRTSAAEIGQGLVGVLAAIVAEELALPYPRVRVLLSDTALTPDGGPTTASRQTFVTGNAARLAAQTLRRAIASTLAELHDLPPDNVRFEEGLAHVNGRAIPMGEVAEMMKRQGLEPKATYEYWAPKTQPLGTGGDMHFAFSFAAQAAEVEVDLDTGEVKVLQLVAAHDIGRAINPLALQGQIEGGMMMGLGGAITEEFIVEDGYVVTDYLARYKMPSIKHTPKITSFIVEDEASDGPYGAKGVGEIASIPTMPAITNAIYNACGVRVLKTPVDQDKLKRALMRGEREII